MRSTFCDFEVVVEILSRKKLSRGDNQHKIHPLLNSKKLIADIYGLGRGSGYCGVIVKDGICIRSFLQRLLVVGLFLFRFIRFSRFCRL